MDELKSINPDTQELSTNQIKKLLTKNLSKSDDDRVKLLNSYILVLIENFCDQVVDPLKNINQFDNNKTLWYFQIYKEGLEAKKLLKHNTEFEFLEIKENQIQKLVDFLASKDIIEYCELGSGFLGKAFTLISSWYRDKLLYNRLQTIYQSENPIDWIKNAEYKDKIMELNINNLPELKLIMDNLNIIIGKLK